MNETEREKKIEDYLCRIYTLSCPVTFEIRYVGITMRELTQRYKEHLKDESITHRGCWIRSILKSGNKPIIELLDTVGADWKFWEQHYIALFKSWGFRLTNNSLGGESSYGVKRTEEQKRHISGIRKQYFIDHPERKILLNTNLTKEQRKRGIDKLRGRKFSDDRRKSMSKIFKGRHHSDHSKNLMLEKSALKKAVFQFDLNGVLSSSWRSMNDAARSLGGHQSAISRAIINNTIAYQSLWSLSKVPPTLKYTPRKQKRYAN